VISDTEITFIVVMRSPVLL